MVLAWFICFHRLTYIWVCVHVCVCIRVCACAHTHMCPCMHYAYACVCVCVCVCVWVCLCVSLYVCLHAHECIYVHVFASVLECLTRESIFKAWKEMRNLVHMEVLSVKAQTLRETNQFIHCKARSHQKCNSTENFIKVWVVKISIAKWSEIKLELPIQSCTDIIWSTGIQPPWVWWVMN